MSERATVNTLEERISRINSHFADADITQPIPTGNKVNNREEFTISFRHPVMNTFVTRTKNTTQISELLEENWECVPELRIHTAKDNLVQTQAKYEEVAKDQSRRETQIEGLHAEIRILEEKLSEMDTQAPLMENTAS